MTVVLLQFKRKTSRSLIINRFKHVQYLDAGKTFMYLEQLNQVCTISTLLQCPQVKLIQSFMILHVFEARYESRETMLDLFKYNFVFAVMRRPCRSAVLYE